MNSMPLLASILDRAYEVKLLIDESKQFPFGRDVELDACGIMASIKACEALKQGAALEDLRTLELVALMLVPNLIRNRYLESYPCLEMWWVEGEGEASYQRWQEKRRIFEGVEQYCNSLEIYTAAFAPEIRTLLNTASKRRELANDYIDINQLQHYRTPEEHREMRREMARSVLGFSHVLNQLIELYSTAADAEESEEVALIRNVMSGYFKVAKAGSYDELTADEFVTFKDSRQSLRSVEKMLESCAAYIEQLPGDQKVKALHVLKELQAFGTVLNQLPQIDAYIVAREHNARIRLDTMDILARGQLPAYQEEADLTVIRVAEISDETRGLYWQLWSNLSELSMQKPVYVTMDAVGIHFSAKALRDMGVFENERETQLVTVE